MSVRGSSNAAAKAAKRVEVDHRLSIVSKLALARMTLREIQTALKNQHAIDVALSTLSRDLNMARQRWRDQERVSIATAQEQELAALAQDEARLRGFLAALPPDEWEARVAYQDRILKIQTLRAKILGTEAPQKIETKVDATVSDRRTALASLPEEDRKKLSEIAAKAYGPRISAVLAPTTNGNGSAPHN